ncbi:Hpt domain-containing protein [Tenacibaculum xiamenense]|uniref:Hpt domain-containing protein n=1 Tax=Tenacibaculum xiamenense TaxID=1261553 RepID=UPI0038952446
MKKLPDLSKFDEICDNDADFKNQMVNILKKEFPTEQKLFYESFEAEKYKETAEIVHKLKHKVNLLNLEDGYLLASEFEKQLLNGSTELSGDFIDILTKIEQFLKKI